MRLPDTIETLRRLVAFDTVSSNSNVELIDWVANRLDDLGVRVFVQHGPEPGKANLFATVGPADLPGLMLSGHSDVVPVTGQDWSSDPFVLTERDGRLHGRGSADMKGFIACCLETLPRLAAAGLRTPVHLALSYDEETDMGGMRQLAAHLAAAPVRPAACIIGEPTMMQVVVANKGAAIYRCRIRGFSVHSSLRDRGVSAVEIGAEVVAFISALQRRLSAGLRHDGFEFPHTSVHAGMIRGGTAHNITARDCEVLFGAPCRGVRRLGRRPDPGALRTGAAAGDARGVPECGIAIDEVVDARRSTSAATCTSRARSCRCAATAPHRVSFGTEAGILQGGVQTVVCGPGDIQVAISPTNTSRSRSSGTASISSTASRAGCSAATFPGLSRRPAHDGRRPLSGGNTEHEPGGAARGPRRAPADRLRAAACARSTAPGRSRSRLRGVDWSLLRRFVVLLGASGSSKSTLLNILRLDVPTSGELNWRDHDLARADERELTRFRREHVGFVFQFYNLIASLTARENVALVTDLAQAPMRPEVALELVGLGARMDHFPAQLSGGEQQRVAIARAIAKRPDVLLCDEPTGALDYPTGKVVLDVIARINLELGTTAIVITHNAAIAGMADRVLRLADGRLVSDERNASRLNASELSW